MSFLYGGTILWVDLTTGEVSRIPTARYADKYIGGRGIGARLVYDHVGLDVAPLSPANILAFGTGPLSGTPFPGCSRIDVMSKSPVTGLLGNSNIGGDCGAELKLAGYDHVVLAGRSERPVYLYVHNDTVELRDARGLWGRSTYETRQAIKEELDNPEIKVLCIGPAGENQVSYGSIHSNLGNAAARTGMGAVMGSKNVKALAVRGTKGVAVAHVDEFLEACLDAHMTVRGADFYQEIHSIGGVHAQYAYVLSGIEAAGDGHEGIEFDPEGSMDPEAFKDRYMHARTGCTGCPVHCMENYYVPGIGGTVISCELYNQLSWEVRNDDMLLWYDLTRRCQEVGIDNTSLTMMLQWLMELHGLGIIDESLTDGVALEWGDREAILTMLDHTVRRVGFGDVLAGGLKVAADYLDARVPADRRGGRSTYWHAMQVNNNPMYGINPRLTSMALSYSVGRRSDCIQDLDMHQFDTIAAPVYPGWSPDERAAAIDHEAHLATELTGLERAGDPDVVDGKAMIVHDMGATTGIPDMVGSCKWHTKWLYLDLTPQHYARALTAGLGREVTADELWHASLRVRNVERAYECRLGRRRVDDTIPRKEFGKPISRGYHEGQHGVEEVQLEQMKDEYYALRGWDRHTGVPTRATLTHFGLEDVADDLAVAGILPSEGDRGSGVASTPHDEALAGAMAGSGDDAEQSES